MRLSQIVGMNDDQLRVGRISQALRESLREHSRAEEEAKRQ